MTNFPANPPKRHCSQKAPRFPRSGVLLLVPLAAVLNCRSAWGKAGDLDMTFGTNGLVLGSEAPRSPETVRHAIPKPDGGVVAAGVDGFVRHLPDGRLDPAFGEAGFASVAGAFLGGYGGPRAIAMQSNGRLIAAGAFPAATEQVTEQALRLRVIRLTQSGSLDPEFGDHGVVQDPLGFWAADLSLAMGVDAESRIVVAGVLTESLEGFWDAALTILRFLPNGSRDPSFGDRGATIIPFTSPLSPSALAFTDDGSVLVAAAGEQSEHPVDPCVLLRFDPRGMLDKSFGTGGFVINALGLPSEPLGGLFSNSYALLVQPDEHILLGGMSAAVVPWLCCSGEDGAPCVECPRVLPVPGVARFKPDGTRDDTFGTAGIAAPPLRAEDDDPFGQARWYEGFARGIALQNDGKVLVAGSSSTAGGSQLSFTIERLTSSGALDPTFGHRGAVVIDVPPLVRDNRLFDAAVALQPIPGPDGKVTVAGFHDGHELVIARLEGDRCGNGSLEDGEACDDGNDTPGDGCAPDCSLALPTTSTTTTTSSTSSTLPPGGCDAEPVGPTFSSIGCRLQELVGRVARDPRLGKYQQTLPPVLEGAAAPVDEAEQACAAGELKRAKKQLKKSGRQMDGYASRLRSLRARKQLSSSAGLRRELVAAGVAILGDVKTLRGTLTCPDDART